MTPRHDETGRLDYLDATRAFALLLGILFHASLSFLPIYIGWAVQDVSTSEGVNTFITVSHSFRMELFFLIAGLLSHLTFHRKGAGQFLRTRSVRLVVPFVVGWFLLRPLIISGWIMGAASLRGDYRFWESVHHGFLSLNTLPSGLFQGTHLWFLYYLLLITALVLAVRAVGQLMGNVTEVGVPTLDRAMVWICTHACGPILFVVPTAIALWFMTYWGMDTPDKSLRPHLPVLVVYAGCFSVGWLLDRQRELLAPLTRLSISRALLAAAAIVGTTFLSRYQADFGHPHRFWIRVGFVLCYATMMWSLVLLTLGVFRKVCQRAHAATRYMADAAYWLYLVHLPIVVWLQVAVAEVAVHWSLKLAFITLVTVLGSLLSYDLFVRSTLIGATLNGKRLPRLLWGKSRPSLIERGA